VALVFTAAYMADGVSRFMCNPSECARITTSIVFVYICISAVSLSLFHELLSVFLIRVSKRDDEILVMCIW
jgi:hypothetical protein